LYRAEGEGLRAKGEGRRAEGSLHRAARELLSATVIGRVTMVQSMLTEATVEPGHSPTKLTYADYELFPDDDRRHEIIDGEHYVTASPVTRHQRISLSLLHLIQSYLDTQPIGELFAAPFDVVLSLTDVVVPDLIYLSNDRAHLLTAKNLQGAPDLVIEILSPSTRPRDEQLKRDLYERVGVAEYWLVDPDGDFVTIYRRDAAGFLPPLRFEKDGIVTTPLLPGFELRLDCVLT
jgi:Uma2 family endonuclease